MSLEPHMMLRCPEASVYIYAMPAGKNIKTWHLEVLEHILKQPIQIDVNLLGKPCLPRGTGFANWSNSKGECVLAYSRECEVGIDLEFYRKRNFEAISKRFFAPSEATGKEEEFYPLWTKKEAYYKCLGGNFFSILKSDLYPNVKIWNLQGPYREKHELSICIKYSKC